MCATQSDNNGIQTRRTNKYHRQSGDNTEKAVCILYIDARRAFWYGAWHACSRTQLVFLSDLTTHVETHPQNARNKVPVHSNTRTENESTLARTRTHAALDISVHVVC